jgi:integrase
VTAAVTVPAAVRSRQLSAEALAVMGRFPPRPVPASWDATAADRFAVARRLLNPSFLVEGAKERHWRKATLLKTLDWLELHQGKTWQARWKASGLEADGAGDWRNRMLSDLDDAGLLTARDMNLHPGFGTGLAQLICGDIIRPTLPWLLATPSPRRVAAEMGRLRDPAGITALNALRETSTAGRGTFDLAMERVAAIMAAKGGPVAAITPGDCIELLDCCRTVFAHSTQTNPFSPFCYELLSAARAFPPAAPSTVRMFSAQFAGPLTAEQMIDRYNLACRPVRDLLVDYLRERQPGIDYGSLNGMAITLGKRFWKDLETHHPGISSLHLPPDVAAAWKQRLQTRTVRTSGGGEQVIARQSTSDALMIIRAFYLDLAQWALDDPARWGPWAAPCPIRASDIQYKKQKSRTKARMDARTRERLPVLPALIAAVDRQRKDAAARLEAALAAPPGQAFTACGQELRRARLATSSPRTWAEEPATGQRRNLTREEDRAFWAWAAIEVLRHTGIRLEELTELSHHSLVQYRLPATGELIPLLSIAPSKTDQERLLVIGPELADVLSTIITRVRGAYDTNERTWTQPMPLLFQRRIGLENRPISGSSIRDLLARALTFSGITGTDGSPLHFQPHDFRRLFTTDAILNGMPPHIAQLILGHADINTTMAYKTVYPEEAIRGHRAFIAQRRATRPSEEYRTPTDAEWDEFLGHFEHRKLALGDCGRAYSTPCIHEHSCIRCPLLRIDPAQRHRLEEIRDNLHARITEAEREGWTGEAEGLRVSLAAATSKIAQANLTAARRADAIHLGIPAYRDIAAATLDPGDSSDR